MKRTLLAILICFALFLTGCNMHVENDTFNIPSDKVEFIEFQKEYIDDEGNSTYRKKVLKTGEKFEQLCEMVRKLDVVRVSNEETPAIDGFPMVIAFKGDKSHYLVINEYVVFYDTLAYVYTDSEIYDSFEKFYSDLNVKEVETTLEWG